MTIEMTLSADRRFEWAVGKVADDKMAWMYGEYFAEMGPVMAEYGNEQAAGFVVVDASIDGVKPTSGALTTWPNAQASVGFHQDPRFLKIQAERDAAFDMFSFGHAFQSMDDVITLNTDSDYAVIFAPSNPLESDPIFDLPLEPDSTGQSYAGKTFSLRPWSDAAEQLMSDTTSGVEVYRIRFNPAAG
ncbi:MAG: hypothetical protein GY945_15870 [Rhodobacteraceae bacterium]|nr:hypothetical protein [Paracoccaceae bacterium]